MGVRTKADDRAAVHRSVAWSALAKLAAKEADRNLLDAGNQYEVAGQFRGTVDGHKIELPVAGLLNVGHDSTSSSSTAADAAHLIALILERVPKTRRAEILDDLPAEFTAAGELPPADDQLLAAADQLVTSLRSRKTITRRGTVHFSRET